MLVHALGHAGVVVLPVDEHVVVAVVQARLAAVHQWVEGHVLLVHEALAGLVHHEAAVNGEAQVLVVEVPIGVVHGAAVLLVGAADLVADEPVVVLADRTGRLGHADAVAGVRGRAHVDERHAEEAVVDHLLAGTEAARGQKHRLGGDGQHRVVVADGLHPGDDPVLEHDLGGLAVVDERAAHGLDGAHDGLDALFAHFHEVVQGRPFQRLAVLRIAGVLHVVVEVQAAVDEALEGLGAVGQQVFQQLGVGRAAGPFHVVVVQRPLGGDGDAAGLLVRGIAGGRAGQVRQVGRGAGGAFLQQQGRLALLGQLVGGQKAAGAAAHDDGVGARFLHGKVGVALLQGRIGFRARVALGARELALGGRAGGKGPRRGQGDRPGAGPLEQSSARNRRLVFHSHVILL